MLQNLRSGDIAVLGYVAYEYHGDAALLGEPEQERRHLLDLADRTGSGVKGVGVHGLHGVDYHQAGLHGLGFGEHVLHAGFAENVAVAVVAAEPLGAHLDLPCALLAADIERLDTIAAQGYLEAQGGLAYAGLAAYQHEGAGDDASAEDAVELGYAESQPGVLGGVDLSETARMRRGAFSARPG